VKHKGTVVRGERKIWRSARSLQDLCDLTARWLTGELRSQPGYFGPVDVDEKDAPGLTETLVLLNRFGMLTDNSQAGIDRLDSRDDKIRWKQRAAVTGFASEGDVELLQEALRGTRFMIDHAPPLTTPTPCNIVVTTRRGRPCTRFGGKDSPANIFFRFQECSPDVHAALILAHEITIYDPTYGQNDLWPALRSAVPKVVHLFG
jgi:hypothetical protein